MPGRARPSHCAPASCMACALVVLTRVCALCCSHEQLVSNRMGMIGAALAVTMLLAVALSGSDEGSGLAIKSAKLAAAKAPSHSLKHMEKVAPLSSLHSPRAPAPSRARTPAKAGRSRRPRIAIVRPGCLAATRRRDVEEPTGGAAGAMAMCVFVCERAVCVCVWTLLVWGSCVGPLPHRSSVSYDVCVLCVIRCVRVYVCVCVCECMCVYVCCTWVFCVWELHVVSMHVCGYVCVCVYVCVGQLRWP